MESDKRGEREKNQRQKSTDKGGIEEPRDGKNEPSRGQEQWTLATCTLLAELRSAVFVFALFLPCSLTLVTDEWLHM